MRTTSTKWSARTVALAGMIVAAGATQTALAGVAQMTFQSLAHNDNTAASHGAAYQESGFNVAIAGEFTSWGTLATAYAGSTALMTSAPAATVTLTPIGGGSFDLLSIQIAKRDTAGSFLPVSVTFTGTKSDSSTVVATFAGTTSGVLLQGFTFPATFTDLTQVTWQGTQRHQFDNVTLIPAPGAAVLLAGALGCIANRRRRN